MIEVLDPVNAFVVIVFNDFWTTLCEVESVGVGRASCDARCVGVVSMTLVVLRQRFA